MKSKIKGIAIAALMAATGALTAAAVDVNVCLHLTTGEKVYFYFENHPVLTFEGQEMHITHSAGQVKVLDYATVRKITFEDKSGVETVTAPDGSISSRAGIVTVTGFSEGTRVSVTSAGGQTLLADIISGTEPYSIDLNRYAKGVYIITAGAVSYKVTN